MSNTAIILLTIITVGIMIYKGTSAKNIVVKEFFPAVGCAVEKYYQNEFSNICSCIEIATNIEHIESARSAIKYFKAKYKKHKEQGLLKYDIGQLTIRLDARKELILRGEVYRLSTG